jgi:hypothetical protein
MRPGLSAVFGLRRFTVGKTLTHFFIYMQVLAGAVTPASEEII